ncbi:hypothetical protein BS78_06G043700 [Paspalum vaginatum]|nr:hypothetical protein BS78_06G043700 [Paspalum vaginatum]
MLYIYLFTIVVINKHSEKYSFPPGINCFWVPSSVRKEDTDQELGKSIERWPYMNHNANKCRYHLIPWCQTGGRYILFLLYHKDKVLTVLDPMVAEDFFKDAIQEHEPTTIRLHGWMDTAEELFGSPLDV